MVAIVVSFSHVNPLNEASWHKITQTGEKTTAEYAKFHSVFIFFSSFRFECVKFNEMIYWSHTNERAHTKQENTILTSISHQN